MSRAELRRQERSQKKDRKRAETVLRQAGFPAFQMPPAPMRTTNLSVTEVAIWRTSSGTKNAGFAPAV